MILAETELCFFLREACVMLHFCLVSRLVVVCLFFFDLNSGDNRLIY